MHELIEHADHINELLARYGVKFGIYKNNQFKEQLFPFDTIPRVIAHEEFERLEEGLKQRVQALNLFLKDIYGKKQIVKDGVIPEEFIFISSGYLAECEGAVPPLFAGYVQKDQAGEQPRLCRAAPADDGSCQYRRPQCHPHAGPL